MTQSRVARPYATRTGTPDGLRIAVHAEDGALGARRIALLIDGSPSTLGPARNAMTRAVTALLGRLPPGSELRVVRFGATPELVVEKRMVADVSAAALVAAVADAEGNTTRLDRALASIEPGSVDHIVVFGDGGMPRVRDDETESALRRRPTTYVLFGAREPSDVLRAHVDAGRIELLDVRSEGEYAVTTRDDAPLADMLASALAPRSVVAIRQGSRIVFSGHVARGQSLVVTTTTRRPTATVAGRRITLTETNDPVLESLPSPERPLPSEARARGRDLPRETILEALRRQFIPPARRCLRADRRGRARYAIRTELVVRLADREVTEIEVTGEVPASLRACLSDALAELVLPAAWAPMIVRYPIHTLEAEVPPILELDEETAQALDRTLGETDDER